MSNFEAVLRKDPKAVLRSRGIEVSDDVEVRVVSDSERVRFLHIPSPPPEGEVDDRDLSSVQGGWASTPICIGGAAAVVAVVAMSIEATLDNS